MNIQDGVHINDHNFVDTVLLNNIRSLHKDFPLCGEPRNELFKVRDDLLLYVISLLRNVTPNDPNASIPQWLELISLLDSHWILPLMYWQIMHVPQGSRPPKEIIDILKLKYHENGARTVIARRQITEIIDAFRKNNIRVLILKGHVLAHTVYPEPATRSSSDIDLMVFPDDVLTARKILEQLGYKCLIKYYDISGNGFCEEEFRQQDLSKNFLQVEIHWTLNEIPMLRTDVDQFFRRSIQINFVDFEFEALSAIDNIIHTAIHVGLKHNSDIRLNWIYDISLLCKNFTRDDWIVLQKRSVECGVRLSVEKILIMAQYWTGLQIPSEFSDFSRWLQPSEKENIAFYYATKERSNTIKRFKLYWPGSAPLVERLKIMIFFILPPLSLMHEQYEFNNDTTVLFYYIKRWFKLILNI